VAPPVLLGFSSLSGGPAPVASTSARSKLAGRWLPSWWACWCWPVGRARRERVRDRDKEGERAARGLLVSVRVSAPEQITRVAWGRLARIKERCLSLKVHVKQKKKKYHSW
jgi:hypothetical protein